MWNVSEATDVHVLNIDSDFMKKQKIKKPEKDNLGFLDYEEKILTNFRNTDKIKRKENKW